MTIQNLERAEIPRPARAWFAQMLASRRLAIASIILLWVVTRIYPVLCLQPLMCDENWHVQKFLEYGVLERHGAAMIHNGFDSGRLPNPWAFNRTHHPFPILWFYALISSLSGAWGIVVFSLGIKLATCVLNFVVMDRFFERASAWWASVLYCLAPCAVQLDVQAVNTTQLSSVLLPVGILLLLAARGNCKPTGVRGYGHWGLGLAVFVTGQMDWFPLTLVPALLALAADWTKLRSGRVVAAFRNRECAQILLGTVLTVLVFVVQVVIYESDPGGLRSHLAMEAGAGKDAGISRAALLFKFMPLRALLFVGPPLLAGLAIGLLCVWRGGLGLGTRRGQEQAELELCAPMSLVVVALVCLGSLAATALVIPMYFLREVSVYTYVLLPAAVLSAVAFERWRRWLPWTLLALCLPGLLEMYLYASVPKISSTSMTVARFVAAHSAATDAVAANFGPGRPPYQSSDVMGDQATRYASDRLIRWNIETPEQLGELPEALKRREGRLVFFLDKTRPFDERLRKELQRGMLMASVNLELPRHQLNVAERARSFFYYKVMRKGYQGPSVRADAGATPPKEEIEVYQVELGSVGR
jgi:hypothetical protein